MQSIYDHDSELAEIFPDYDNDEAFGGDKKYIRIIIRDGYIVQYIGDDSDDEIEEYDMHESVADRLQYFTDLIKREIILVDEIYDINSEEFIEKIIRSKFNLTIQHFTRKEQIQTCIDKSFNSKSHEKIRNYFHHDTIINGEIYATRVDEGYNRNLDYEYNIKKEFSKIIKEDYATFDLDIGRDDYIFITVYKVHDHYYEMEYLRKYLPYSIVWDKELNYYIRNRDYKYITTNSGVTPENYKIVECIHLFDDGCSPWHGKEHYINLCNSFNQIVDGLNIWLNENEHSKQLLELFTARTAHGADL